MELIVIVAAGLVIYCGYLAMLDERKAWQRSRAVRTRRAARSSRSSRNKVKASISCPEDGVVAHPGRFLGFNLDVAFNDNLRRQLGSILQSEGLPGFKVADDDVRVSLNSGRFETFTVPLFSFQESMHLIECDN